jgi:DNA-binding IclR family transcriptional regulator
MARPRSEGTLESPKVLDKALRVLESFELDTPVWAEVDLRHHLGLPSTTLNRILRSLESAGYLLRREDGRYQLGIAAVRLGNRASEALDLTALLNPIVREVSLELNELVMLAVPEYPAGRARYIAGHESSSKLRITSEVGGSVPLQAGATAKVLLAHQPPELIEQVLAIPVEPLAAGTITDPGPMRAQLVEIHERGWAFSWEETYDGAFAVAAPLLDQDGLFAFAAIGVAAPTSRHTPEFEQQIREVVIDAAHEAARDLGYGLPSFASK